jgi:hypothetical protein
LTSGCGGLGRLVMEALGVSRASYIDVGPYVLVGRQLNTEVPTHQEAGPWTADGSFWLVSVRSALGR